MGTFLLDNLMVHGDAKSITFLWNTGKEFLWFKPHLPGASIYVVYSYAYEDTHVNLTTVYAVDYQTLHKHLAYPSCNVISHVRENTQNFLDVTFPEKDPICSGCAYGKMPNHAFSLNPVCAKKAFELIHLDLKSFSIDLYQKYKYLIVFIDDYIRFAWTSCTQTKSKSIKHMHDFIALVSIQHNSKVVNWISDAGGEYKSNAFDALLKQHRIKILQSALHTPHQNSHAERFMCTIMDKAEAMHHKACCPATGNLPPNMLSTSITGLWWSDWIGTLHMSCCSPRFQISHTSEFSVMAHMSTYPQMSRWINSLQNLNSWLTLVLQSGMSTITYSCNL